MRLNTHGEFNRGCKVQKVEKGRAAHGEACDLPEGRDGHDGESDTGGEGRGSGRVREVEVEVARKEQAGFRDSCRRGLIPRLARAVKVPCGLDKRCA